MVRHVAVEEEIAGQLLAEAGAALSLQIQGLGWTDYFDIHPVRLSPDHGILYGTVRRRVPKIHVVNGARAPRPADCAPVRVMGVKDLRATMHQTVLRRIAHVGSWNRGRRISEGIGAVPHGFVFEPEVLMLHVHVVDAEGLAAVIQRATARPVGIGQRIALREEVALLVHGTKGFIAHLVIDDHELAEVRAGSVLDDRLPAALHRSRIAGPQRIEIVRPFWLHDERAEETHDRQLTIVAVAVELPAAFLRGGMDVPLEVLTLPLRHDRVRIRGGCCLAGRVHHHAGPMDVQADVLAAFQLVLQRHLYAVALVPADHQRLDPLTLETVRHRAGVMPFLLAPRLVLGLLFADLVYILGQHVHVTGIEIQPLVDRDLDVDG